MILSSPATAAAAASWRPLSESSSNAMRFILFVLEAGARGRCLWSLACTGYGILAPDGSMAVYVGVAGGVLLFLMNIFVLVLGGRLRTHVFFSLFKGTCVCFCVVVCLLKRWEVRQRNFVKVSAFFLLCQSYYSSINFRPKLKTNALKRPSDTRSSSTTRNSDIFGSNKVSFKIRVSLNEENDSLWKNLRHRPFG